MMATSVDTAPPTYPHGQGLTTLLAGAAWWGFWLLLAAPLAVGAVANGASWTWDGAFAVLSTFFRAGLEVAHGWGPLYRLALLLLALVAVGLGWRRIAATPAEARRRRRVLWGVRAALFGLSAWGFFHAVGQLALVTETVLNGALVDPPADDQAFKDTLLVELARAGATLDFDQVIVETLQREDIDRARVHAQAARLLGIPLRPETVKAYGEATDWGSSLRRGSWAVLEGAFTGESASLAGLAGALTLDLTPAGDLRDVAVQLGRMASEKPADEVVLGLSLFGMALTAATFVAPAQTVPMTTGKAVLKGARHARRSAALQAGGQGVRQGQRERGRRARQGHQARLPGGSGHVARDGAAGELRCLAPGVPRRPARVALRQPVDLAVQAAAAGGHAGLSRFGRGRCCSGEPCSSHGHWRTRLPIGAADRRGGYPCSRPRSAHHSCHRG
jgi:hypothetical protein